MSQVFDPECAAEVDQDETPGRVEPDGRVELRDAVEDQVDDHDGEECREHLDDQEEQAGPAGVH